MEIKTISDLIQILNRLNEPFEEKSLSENKLLLQEYNEVQTLIHGERSRHTVNYRPSSIEAEVIQLRNAIQSKILVQILKKQTYAEESIDDCLEDFALAHKLNYSTFGAGLKLDWSSNGMAQKAADHVFEVLFLKLKEALSKDKKNRKEYLVKVAALYAKYNWSTEQYKRAKGLVEEFDPKNKFELVKSYH